MKGFFYFWNEARGAGEAHWQVQQNEKTFKLFLLSAFRPSRQCTDQSPQSQPYDPTYSQLPDCTQFLWVCGLDLGLESLEGLLQVYTSRQSSADVVSQKHVGGVLPLVDAPGVRSSLGFACWFIHIHLTCCAFLTGVPTRMGCRTAVIACRHDAITFCTWQEVTLAWCPLQKTSHGAASFPSTHEIMQ